MNQRKAFVLTAAVGTVFFTALFFAGGCGKKEADTAVAPPTSLKGQAPAVPTGEVKGTPEQEAAKQKAIQDGPAIQAAIEAQRAPAPAPK